MGGCYPALARAITAARDDVGRRVSRLYALNTVGGIAGSLLAGFVLLPVLGTMATLKLLVLGAVGLGAYAAWPRPGASRSWRRAFVAGIVASLIVGIGTAWHVSLEDLYRSRLPAGSEILHLAEGTTSTVMVADYSEPRVRRIWIQSCWVAGTGGSQKMLGHLSMLHAVDHPSNVGIAFGTGQSFGSALLYEPTHMECVDLDREVVDAGGHWFADHNHQLLAQPNVGVTIQDGRRYLAGVREPVDAILMEPLQPWSAGAVNLYTVEFYELAWDALGDRGVLTQWLPLDDIPPDVMRSVVGSFAAVFPTTYLYLDNFDLWIVGHKGDQPPSMNTWRQRLDQPQIHAELAPIGYPDVESILSTLVAGPNQIRDLVGDAPLLTDDRPFMEFVAPRTMNGYHAGDNFAALAEVCHDPLAELDPARTQGFPAALYAGDSQRALMHALLAIDAGRFEEADRTLHDAVTAAPSVTRLRFVYREATQRLASQFARGGDGVAAIDAYTRHLAVDPEFGGGWLNLGILHAEHGRPDLARAALDRAVAYDEVRPNAEQMLSMLPPAPPPPPPPPAPSTS